MHLRYVISDRAVPIIVEQPAWSWSSFFLAAALSVRNRRVKSTPP